MSALACPKCSSRNIININLDVDGGKLLAFFSCHDCDERWWNQDGNPIDLPDVLELARGSRG